MATAPNNKLATINPIERKSNNALFEEFIRKRINDSVRTAVFKLKNKIKTLKNDLYITQEQLRREKSQKEDTSYKHMYNEKCLVLEAVVSSATGFSQKSWELPLPDVAVTYHLQTEKNGKFKLARRKTVMPDEWLESILLANEKLTNEKLTNEKPANVKPANVKLANVNPADVKPAKEKHINEIPDNVKHAPEKTVNEKPANEKHLKGKPVIEKPAKGKPVNDKPVNEKPAKERPAKAMKEDRWDPSTQANPQAKENVPFKNIDCVKLDFKGKPVKQDVLPPNIIRSRLFQACDNSIT